MEPMMAVLKSGKTVLIDTSFLCDNQYNTLPEEGEERGKRIFDGEIVRIINDVRDGLGKCKYCGKIVRRGEEEEHFKDRESMKCEKCFYWRDKLVNSKTKRIGTQEIDLGNGRTQKITTKETVDTYETHCTFMDGDFRSSKTDCEGKECRAYGIEWFTPENTFFLRYPNGFESRRCLNLFDRGFKEYKRWEHSPVQYVYHKQIGSYTLSVNGKRESDNVWLIDSFTVRNCRHEYIFRYKDNALYIYDRTFGWRRANHFGSIPQHMEDDILHIVSIVMEE